MTTGKFISVGDLLSVEEARRVEALLKEAGIPAYVTGAASALTGSGQNTGGITIEVAEEDLDHALLVLQRHAENAQSSSASKEEPEENPFVTLEVYYEPEEAEFAARILRAKEIPCELSGTAPLSNPYLGNPIVGYQLRVREEGADRACLLLGMTLQEEDNEEDMDEESDLPSSTAIRHLRSDVTADRRVDVPPEQAEMIQAKTRRKTSEGLIEKADLPEPVAEVNKQEPRVVPKRPLIEETPQEEKTAQGEETVSPQKEDHLRENLNSAEMNSTRALRSAIFGMIAFPLFFHLYTFWLIYRIVSSDEDLSSKGTTRLYVALGISGARTLFSAFLFRETGWHYIEWILFWL